MSSARAPGLALERPGERRRAPPVQHRAARRRVDRAGRHEHAVADGADRLAGAEGVDGHLLHLEALEVGAHAAGPVPARQHQRVVGAAPRRAPVQRRAEGGVVEQRGVGRRVPPRRPAGRGRRPSRGAAAGRSPTDRARGRVTIRSSACARPVPRAWRSTTSWPAARQHLPADGHLGGVEVEGRDRHEDGGHRRRPATLRTLARAGRRRPRR